MGKVTKNLFLYCTKCLNKIMCAKNVDINVQKKYYTHIREFEFNYQMHNQEHFLQQKSVQMQKQYGRKGM